VSSFFSLCIAIGHCSRVADYSLKNSSPTFSMTFHVGNMLQDSPHWFTAVKVVKACHACRTFARAIIDSVRAKASSLVPWCCCMSFHTLQSPPGRPLFLKQRISLLNPCKRATALSAFLYSPLKRPPLQSTACNLLTVALPILHSAATSFRTLPKVQTIFPIRSVISNRTSWGGGLASFLATTVNRLFGLRITHFMEKKNNPALIRDMGFHQKLSSIYNNWYGCGFAFASVQAARRTPHAAPRTFASSLLLYCLFNFLFPLPLPNFAGSRPVARSRPVCLVTLIS